MKDVGGTFFELGIRSRQSRCGRSSEFAATVDAITRELRCRSDLRHRDTLSSGIRLRATKCDDDTAEWARVALQRMLDLPGGAPAKSID